MRKNWKFSLLIITIFFAFSKITAAENLSGLKPINQKKLQALVIKTAKELGLPGAFVLLQTPQGEFSVAYGTTKIGTSDSPTSQTHFRIASVTKTMTAAVIVQQAQEGKIAFTDPVSKYLPEVPNGDNITIADLLRMRSGLYNYTDSTLISEKLDKQPSKKWTSNEIIKIAFSQPPYFKPNTAYNYSNTNYALLGLIAEKIDNKPLNIIFEQRLFKPLGIKNTLLPTNDKLPQPYSHGYLYGGSVYALVDKDYPLDMQKAVKAGKLKPIDYTFLNPSYALAAGGVISTADDLAVWIKALVTGKMFNPTFQQYWLTSLVPENKPDGQQYGYGIVQLRFSANSIYFHGGENPGYNTFIGHDPNNHMTLIVWANLPISIDNQLAANTIMVKILDQIYVDSPLKK